MKYKVGDKVRIIPDLKEGQGIPGIATVVNSMLEFAGAETKIKKYYEDGMCRLQCDGGKWYWPEETLIPITQTNVDIIRQMSNKELEKFLAEFSICDICWRVRLNKNYFHSSCEEAHKIVVMHKWLNQPVESERKE